jgi:hypothetical protein
MFRFFRPSGACPLLSPYPGLAPWANEFRPFGARPGKLFPGGSESRAPATPEHQRFLSSSDSQAAATPEHQRLQSISDFRASDSRAPTTQKQGLQITNYQITNFSITQFPNYSISQLLNFPNLRPSTSIFQRYRSISPSTISMLPMAATTSAISLPSHILGRACRFARHAARICTR